MKRLSLFALSIAPVLILGLAFAAVTFVAYKKNTESLDKMGTAIEASIDSVQKVYRDSLQQLFHNIELSLFDPLVNNEPDEIDTVLRRILAYPAVAQVYVTDSAGNMLANGVDEPRKIFGKKSASPFKAELSNSQAIFYSEANNFFYTKPFINQGELAGRLYVIVSLDEIQKIRAKLIEGFNAVENNAQESSLRTIVYTILIVIIGVFLAYFVARMLSNQLQTILHFATNIANGDFKAQIILTKNAPNEYLGLATSLQDMAKKLQEAFLRIEDQNQNLERQVAERTLQLQRQTNNLKVMFDNMPIAIFTLDSNLLIEPNYSKYLETIFSRSDLAGKSMGQLFANISGLKGDFLVFMDALGILPGASEIAFEVNEHLLLNRDFVISVNGQEKNISVNVAGVFEGEVIDKILVMIRDTTDLTLLKAESLQKERRLGILLELVNNSRNHLLDFLDYSDHVLVSVGNWLSQNSSEEEAVIKRELHSLKGNARCLQLKSIAAITHSLESEIAKESNAAKNDKQNILAFAKLKSEVQEYRKVFNESLNSKESDNVGEDDFLRALIDKVIAICLLLYKKNGNDEFLQIHQILHQAHFLSLNRMIYSGIMMLNKLCKERRIGAPIVDICDNQILMHRNIENVLTSCFNLIFLNSLDHGFKNSVGTIKIDIQLKDGNGVLYYSDSGSGLNIAKLAGGKIPSEQESLQVARKIFTRGVSTADRITETSGRGVGLDAVVFELKKIGAAIDIELLSGVVDGHSKFRFVIVLPGKYLYKSEDRRNLNEIVSK